MKQFVGEDRLVRKYLLGDLGQDELERIEERLLTDAGFAEEVSIAQTELIDDYVGGKLSDEERGQFEKHFRLPPGRLQKLRFARAFDKYTEEWGESASHPAGEIRPVPSPRRALSSRQSRRTKFGLALAAALAVLAVCCVAALLFEKGWFRRPSARADGRRELLEKELVRLNKSQGQGSTASAGYQASSATFMIPLKPILVRGSGENRGAALPADVEVVQLRLEMATDKYQSYRAVLQTDEDMELAMIDDLRADTTDHGRQIVLNLPREYLPPDGYQIKLGGLNAAGQYEDAGLYPFQILTK
jgi:hypothetical protein